ncbi:hypothetical protein Q1695_014311 [Nippostrongylus brasiliensis]|nr:hypothetical protein Q1695_014311 [Nippostrongylus brasiliensis]
MDRYELSYGYPANVPYNPPPRYEEAEEEVAQKVELRQEEFGGLVGSIAGFRGKVEKVAGDVFGIGGHDGSSPSSGRGLPSNREVVLDILNDIFKGKDVGDNYADDRDGHSGGKKGKLKKIKEGRKRETKETQNGGKSSNNDIDSIIEGIGSLIVGSGGRGKYAGGGSNVRKERLKGGMVKLIEHLVAKAAHRYLGVDPNTGRIIGAVAGNVMMGLGGKDNKLGSIGKVVLDNIVSGKFRRDVKPFVRPEPRSDRAGVPSPIQPVPSHEPQAFYAERQRCLKERRLYEDPHFPANDYSLYFSRRPPTRVTWLRPGEIARDPQLFTEGHTRFDVVQGELGDCWLLAAVANLTLKDELFYRVVPPDQSFTENYAGIFHFQFWQYGKWVDVVIDDRLPTSNGRLLYMHSPSTNEFWSALLEKAYAKLHGSYEALRGGTTSEALEDMTGGLTEFFDLRQPPANLMPMMMRGFEMGSLFACSMEPDPRIFEARMPNGLVKGHAYSITGIRLVNGPRGEECLLRIRNPWGNQQEWNGAWSDGSYEWRSIPSHVKQELGLRFDHDGEFWMSFDDFMRNFEKMEICNLGPDVMNEIYEMTGVRETGTVWATNTFDGAWVRNRTAGGCRNFISTFASNPQYWVRLIDPDPYDDDELCTVIFAVMQKYRRNLKSKGLDNVPIGFAVYEVGELRGRLTADFFRSNRSVMRSVAFINLREITGRFRVPPGNYVVIPSTFEPNEEAEFMLRIYTNGYIESREL